MRSYQNIILYKETADYPWNTPSKIANTFLNRFVIDEDFACEIMGTYELSNNDEENFGVIHKSLERASAYRGYSKNVHFVFARNYLSLGTGPHGRTLVNNYSSIHIRYSIFFMLRGPKSSMA